MAGILNDKLPRLISARTHAVIDYVHAATNFAAASVFHRRDTRARNAALALGAGVLANALMTDYPLGVFRLYSFKVHGILDYGVAALSAGMAELAGIEDAAAKAYFRLQGAGETLIAAASDYDDNTGARKIGERLDEELKIRAIA